jgi:hypothetical protein
LATEHPSWLTPGGVFVLSQETIMIVPKGYRARENAALQRKTRGRVDEEVRAQRASLLEPKIQKSVLDSRDSYELALVGKADADPEPVKQPVEQTEQPAEITNPENGDEAVFEDDEKSPDEPETSEKPEAAPAASKAKSKTKKK